MFVETLWNFIQFTDYPLFNFAVALYIVILAALFVFKVVNVPFVRLHLKEEENPQSIGMWIFRYWLTIPIIAVLYFINFWRLMITIIISVAMMMVYFLRRVVQLTALVNGDSINAYLFYLTRFETSAGEILNNERMAHQQQMYQVNRQVAASRNVASAYRQAAVNVVDLVTFAQKSGGYYNMQWVSSEAKRGLTTAIQRAEQFEKQLKNTQNKNPNNNNGQHQTNGADYVSYTTNNGKGQGQPKQQKGQQQQKGQGQPKQQKGQQQQYQPQPQPFVQGQQGQQGMNSKQRKAMEREQREMWEAQQGGQQGNYGQYAGQVDPRMHPNQYQPDNGFVPFNQSNGWDQYPNDNMNQPYGEQFGTGYNNPNAWQQEEPQGYPVQQQEWFPEPTYQIPPPPVWVDRQEEPVRRDKNQKFRPLNY